MPNLFAVSDLTTSANDKFLLNFIYYILILLSHLFHAVATMLLKVSNLFAKYLKISQERYQISEQEASYFVFTGTIANRAYDDEKENINILKATGKIVDVAGASDHLNLKALSETVTKYYICYPKG